MNSHANFACFLLYGLIQFISTVLVLDFVHLQNRKSKSIYILLYEKNEILTYKGLGTFSPQLLYYCYSTLTHEACLLLYQ